MKSLWLLAALLLVAPPDQAFSATSKAASKKEKKEKKPKSKKEKPAATAAKKAGKPKPSVEGWPTAGEFIRPSTEPGGEFDAGVSMYSSGMHRQAMLMASSLLAIDPSHAGAWHLLGNCRWAAGDRSGAREAWGRSLRLMSNGALSQYSRSKKASGAPPVPQAYRTARVEALAARALLESGQPDAAVRRAEAATVLDPLSPADWDLLGDCRQAARDPVGARLAWNRALKLVPNDGSIKEKLLAH